MNKLFYFFVLFIIPLSYYIKSIEILYVIGMTYSYIILFLANKHPIKKRVVNNRSIVIFFFFMISTIISNMYFYLIDSESAKTYFSPYARMWFYFFEFTIAFTLINNRKKLEKLIKLIIFSSIIPNIIGLLQIKLDIFTIVMSKEGARRIGSTMAHPNFYGYFLVIVLICILYKATNVVGKNKSLLFLCHFYAFFTLFLLYNTNSRTTFFLGVIIYLINIYFDLKKYLNSKQLKYLRASLLTVFFLLFMGLIAYFYFNNTFTNTRYNFVENSGSFAWRVMKWKTALSYWFEDPFAVLIGFGWMSSFVFTTNELYSNYAMHNEYVRILFETGILGFSLYIIFLCIVFQNIKNIKDWKLKKFFFSVYFLFLIGSLTGNLLGVPENTTYFFILFAVTINHNYFREVESNNEGITHN
ncbi:O-antigen ligase family protein [Peribacillus frigoritolerans]